MVENNLNFEELQERLALFALDAISNEEKQILTEQIDKDPALQADVESLRAVAAELAFAPEECSPPATVRHKLLAHIAAEKNSSRTQPITQPTHYDVRADEGNWENMYPGIFCKTLFVEPSNGYITTLMKLEPGARLPNHHHRGAEQCLVIAGDIEMNERQYKAGDFTVALAGSDHINLISRTGGMVLLVSPPDYELLAK